MCSKEKENKKDLVFFLNEAYSLLSKTSESPMIDAKEILKKTLNFSDVDIVTKRNYQLTEKEISQFEEMLGRRLDNEPIAYIVGHKAFMDYEFKVGKGVLIPRADTEILVEKTSSLVGDRSLKGLEIGLGSGCISLSLLKICENLTMMASDISNEAISYARENARLLSLEDRIEIFEADLIDDSISNKQYDFIVSNPPYIDEIEMEELISDVKDFEPRLALYGGIDGLDYYRRILDLSDERLKNNGFVAFEIGYNQAERVKKLFEEHNFVNINVYQDFGGFDRVVIGEKND